MIISLIAAVSRDGFIAQDDRIPWNMPRDVQHFRDYCLGKYLLVGRKTFDQMHGWFHHHHPLIMTRDPAYQPEVGQVVRTVPEAIAKAKDELVVLGGGEMFTAALPYATRLVLTHVDTELGNGTPFPKWDPNAWSQSESHAFLADESHPFAMEIAVYERPAILPQPN